jgi:hypothetical protein
MVNPRRTRYVWPKFPYSMLPINVNGSRRASPRWPAISASLALALAGAATSAVGAAPPVDFQRDIQPLLASRCYDCHGSEKPKGGLQLTTRATALKGGKSGEPVIVPGQSAKSPLLTRVTTHDDDERMPPKSEPLSAQQIDLLKRWVDQGAVWPDNLKHWAYQKPGHPTAPAVKNSAWPRNDLDRFILARLEQEGLKPSAEADRAILLRRVALDLIGLPPTPTQVSEFLNDTSENAYEKAVDRLLASPQYGERWARPWLDLARYADSNGFQRDGFRDLWAYRDWVVNAFNADMPFDRFTIEQVAGDLLPNATLDQKTATGFNRCTTVNVEAGTDQEENRVNQVFDRVNTTATVWLGSTLECAQCHNHKYDPFSQRDYYQIFAYFNNTEIETKFRSPKSTASVDFTGPMMTLPSKDLEQKRGALQAKIDKLAEDIAARKPTAVVAKKAAKKAAGPATSQWQPLEVAEFRSAGGATGKVQPDKSVLVTGENPIKDTYTVTVHTKLTGITAFKLETLTDPSLPGQGPGRGDAARPNFILSSFKVDAASETDPNSGQSISFKSARADFSQKGWDVSGAIDNDDKTGWAINPEFHLPHHAIFTAEQSPAWEEGTVLTFTLDQTYGGSRTIGRFRLSAVVGKLEENGEALDPAVKRLQEERDKLIVELKKLEPPQTLVMSEMTEPRMSAVFVRGNFLERGEPVKPGVPAVLHALPDGPPNRLTFARWLASTENPLVARVTVNRWWAEFFGQGIVSTVEDFGIKGEAPTHPELLDWLATEFMARGWSMKAMHKLIVMSATYRQSSKVTPELLAKDDQNKLYARGPRFRLDAETIRDNALSAAGLLSLKQGGPPVKPFQPEGVWKVTGLVDNTYKTSDGEDAYRRGIYIVWRRSAPYPSFMNFDAQVRAACVVKRSRSNTPLQALTLLNDPVYVEAAMALARRALAEQPGADAAARVRNLFRLCLARAPKDNEVDALVKLYEAQRAGFQADAQAAKALIGSYTAPANTSTAEFAAWYAVATALLNLDEMITKG